MSEQNRAPNETARIEAFSDGVFAIAITLLILEIQVPPRYACRVRIVDEHVNVAAITKQYALGPIMYGVLIAIAFYSADWVLILSALYALYFALPPSLWNKGR